MTMPPIPDDYIGPWKICSRCSTAYPETRDYFYWWADKQDFFSRCRSCRADIIKAYRANPAGLSTQRVANRIANIYAKVPFWPEYRRLQKESLAEVNRFLPRFYLPPVSDRVASGKGDPK